MKKLIALVFLLTIAATSFAQTRANRVYAPDTITVDEVESRYTADLVINGTYESVVMQALCTQLGGTTDGKLTAQASIDGTSYVTLNEGTDYIYFFPDNDTLTMTNGAIFTVTIKGSPFTHYRFKATGTANDTTQITPKYIFK